MPLSEDDQTQARPDRAGPCQGTIPFAETVNIDRWRRRRIVLAGAAFTIGIVVLDGAR